MPDLPSPNRIDLAVVLFVLALAAFGEFVYPTQVVRSAVWITNLTVVSCWGAYVLYRLVYDGATGPPTQGREREGSQSGTGAGDERDS